MTTDTRPILATGNREFDLHLHVLEHRCEERAPRYTIGVWDHAPQGAGLRAICHIRSLAGALLAISAELDSDDRGEKAETSSLQSTARPLLATEPISNGHAPPKDTESNGTGRRSRAARCRLPDERRSLTHKFSVGGHEGYITLGLYPDGQPGEVFITMAKEGSTVSGLMSSFAQALSIGLQHGVPLELFCEKFSHTRFEPSGWTGNSEIRNASSVCDYIFRWIRMRFIADTTKPLRTADAVSLSNGTHLLKPSLDRPADITAAVLVEASDAPSCRHCGSLTKRNGSCFICENCGASSGCS